jgi:hypothetical protein
MKKTVGFLNCVLVILASLPLAAQITFEITYGGQVFDSGSNVLQTPDGGYITTAWSKSSGFGGWDILVLKTNDHGDTLWTRTFGGKLDDCSEGLLLSSDGGFMIAGYVNDASSAAIGTMKAALIKLNAQGILEWQKALGWNKCDDAYMDIAHATGGGFYIAGVSNIQFGDWDSFLLRVNAEGDVLWHQLYGISTADIAWSTAATSDGGCVLSGNLGMYTYVIKTDSMGNLQWQRTFEIKSYSEGRSIAALPDGGFILASTAWSSANDQSTYDIYLLRIKADGRLAWRKKFGGEQYDSCWRVRPSQDGGFVAVGSTGSFGAGDRDVYLFKVDSLGHLLWQRQFGGDFDDAGVDFDFTSDGGVIITGTKGVNAKGTNSQLFLIKTDNEGNVITSIEDRNTHLPADFTLYQNYPNPFNLSTTVEFECPAPKAVTLEIHDTYGRKVKILTDGIQPAGRHRVDWNAMDDQNRIVPSGIYLCRMTVGDQQKTIKLALMK